MNKNVEMDNKILKRGSMKILTEADTEYCFKAIIIKNRMPQVVRVIASNI